MYFFRFVDLLHKKCGILILARRQFDKIYDETNSEYKHLVNSRFELFSKQNRIFVSCFLNNSNLEFTRCLYSEFVSSCKLYIIKAYGS